jgi:D-inositol-3-phosphate glycosyltransferase
MLSVHTCPLAAPGGKETGGMNVYVRETARELCRMGARVDVFTRSQNPGIPRIVDMGHGARVVHLQAGPEAPMPREAVHAHLDQLVEGVERFRRAEGARYDLIHAHYWLSGVAGLALRARWDAPLVQMFHTLGRLKNTVAQSPSEVEPELRIEEESRIVREADRIVAANAVERAHLVWYYGARADRVDVIPCGVDTDLFRPMDRAAAKNLLALPPEPLLIYVGRLQPIKGLETLVHAMPRVPDATLLIIGGDQDEPENGHGAHLRECVRTLGLEGRVRFLGAQPQDRLRLYYAAADATVMPSYY